MSVCKDCEVRTVGCHAKCESYIKFREDREKKCEARNKARQIDMYMRDHRGVTLRRNETAAVCLERRRKMMTQETIDKKIRISQEEIALAEKYIEELEKRKQELQEFIDSLNTMEAEQDGRQEKGEIYWYISNLGAVSSEIESGSSLDEHRFDTGNYYLSKKEMVKTEEKILLYRLLDRFSRQNGWTDEIWEDDEKCKYYIFFDYICNQIRIGDRYCTADSPGVYFASEVVAQQAIEKYLDLIVEVMAI